MTPTAQIHQDQPDPTHPRTEIQLGDLGELRAVGMGFARELNKIAVEKLPEAQDGPLAGERSLSLAFARVSRSVRQIIVLEQELMGLREPPVRRAGGGGRAGLRVVGAEGDGSDLNDLDDYNDLNDYNDLDDYSEGSMDERIAAVMKEIIEVEPGKCRWKSDYEAELAAHAANPDIPMPTPNYMPVEDSPFLSEIEKQILSPRYRAQHPPLPGRRRGRGPP